MSLNEIGQKIKSGQGFVEKEAVFVVLLILLVGVGGFGLGRLSLRETATVPIQVFQSANVLEATLGTSTTKTIENSREATPEGTEVGEKMYVASKTGKKYHYPWCPGAKTIAEANKIWFGSKEEAQKAGYTPAANCKGL